MNTEPKPIVKRRYFVQTDNYKGGIAFDEVGDAIAFLRLSLKGKRAEVAGYADSEHVRETTGNKLSLRIFDEPLTEAEEEAVPSLADLPIAQPESGQPASESF